MLNFLSPKGSRIYTSPTNEVWHTVVIFDHTNCGKQVCCISPSVDVAWLNGFPNFRVIYFHNPINLVFEDVLSVLMSVTIGTLWLVYPWSGTTSSMMPSPNNGIKIKTILEKFSAFQKKMQSQAKVTVNFIIEVTSAVDIQKEPPTFPKGFSTKLQTFGGVLPIICKYHVWDNIPFL